MGRRRAARGGNPRASVLAALVFLVALNLRPSLTTVGPLLPQIGQAEGLSESVQGLLGSIPLLAFAAVSPLVHHVAQRLGTERAILVALTLLAAGATIRSYAGPVGLWAGTVVVGCAIAIGNVLVPAIVKRDYSAHVSRATGIYSACITIAASIGSAVAVPLSASFGWEHALAFWAIPALVVALLWLPRVLGSASGTVSPVAAVAPRASVWRQPTAWFLTAFMGLQSTTFYVMVTWLPSVEIAGGVSEQGAGWHLFLYQLVGIASALAIPRLMQRPDSQIAAAATASAPMLIAVLGLLVAPAWSLLWAIIAGLGSGASLVVALSLIGLRGRTARETTQLSGMVQSLGYLLAAVGPVTAGALAEATGGWRAPLTVLALLAALQVAVSVPAGRDRRGA